MKIEVDKKYFFAVLSVVIIFAAIIGVYAYGTNNPAAFGHSAGEIEGGGGGGAAWRSVDLSNTQLFVTECAYMWRTSSSYGPYGYTSTFVQSDFIGSSYGGFSTVVNYNSKNTLITSGGARTLTAIYESCPAGVTGITGTYVGSTATSIINGSGISINQLPNGNLQINSSGCAKTAVITYSYCSSWTQSGVLSWSCAGSVSPPTYSITVCVP